MFNTRVAFFFQLELTILLVSGVHRVASNLKDNRHVGVE